MLDRQRDEREASLPDAGPMRIALDGRRILLEQALAAWPRRGTTLVEINCGAGFLQQSLRADGFDVTGCEPSDFLRRRFAEVNGSHFTVEAGHSDLLPFDSESFDWGILHLGECLSPQQIDASLRELLRVVSLGFAITFWNRTSLAGRSASFPPDFPLYPAWSILRRLAWHGLGTFRARSALSGPVSTWRAADAGLGFTCYHFSADEDIDDGISYYLDCVASYPAGLTAAQVAQRVQTSYHYDNNSFSSEADRDDYIRRQLQNEISDEYADRHDGAYPDEKYLNEETERRLAERTGMATPESAQA